MYKLALDHLFELYALRGDGNVVEDFIKSIKEDLEWNDSKTLEFLKFGKSKKSDAMETYRVIRGEKGLQEFKIEIYEKYRALKSDTKGSRKNNLTF